MRLQLALNVSDLDAAVDFYERLFGVEVAKRKPGYANFAIAEPPLKLVLFEGAEDGTINHLGVEVETTTEVDEAHARLVAAGLDATTVVETQCCHADKVETWIHGPDATRWEFYVKTADVEGDDVAGDGATCCVDEAGDSTGSALPVAAGATHDEAARACCAA